MIVVVLGRRRLRCKQRRLEDSDSDKDDDETDDAKDATGLFCKLVPNDDDIEDDDALFRGLHGREDHDADSRTCNRRSSVSSISIGNVMIALLVGMLEKLLLLLLLVGVKAYLGNQSTNEACSLDRLWPIEFRFWQTTAMSVLVVFCC